MSRGKLLVQLALKKSEEKSVSLNSSSEISEPYQDSSSDYVPETDTSSTVSEEFPFQCISNLEKGKVDTNISPYLGYYNHPENIHEHYKETIESDDLISDDITSMFTVKTTTIETKSLEKDYTILENMTTSNEPIETQVISNSTQLCNYKNEYGKKSWARERPTVCPLCYENIETHFTRHLFRHHKDDKHVIMIKKLKTGSQERLALISALRKQGYFHIKTDKNISIPVRTSKNPDSAYFVCVYCLGQYTKKYLYKHTKICKQKPLNDVNASKKCLSNSQTFLASITSDNNEFLKTSRIKEEVFNIMRPDDISLVAKSDPLICLYGEMLLNKHKRQQMSVVVSNKIREIARLLIALKSINGVESNGLFECLRPDMFQKFIISTKIVSGYDETTKNFKAPSLALHMGTNLKVICDIALKLVIEERRISKICWTNRIEKKMQIEELKKLIEGHWCSELSSLALKDIKEKQWENPTKLPLASDIDLFQNYVYSLAEKTFEALCRDLEIRQNFKILTECVLALTVMFNRKRIGDVQYIKVDTYCKERSTHNQEIFTESLSDIEKLITKNFKRVVTGGKGSKPVAILFSKKIQRFISLLLKIRRESAIIPETNPYLFANPDSTNRWMAGVSVMRKLAKNCGAKNPTLLTSTRFRKHIATTLQLMNLDDNEIEQIATFMGHTKKTHCEFYRLPENIYQTAKVAKILLLLEKGKGKEFKGKNLNEIKLDDMWYCSSDSENDNSPEEMDLVIRENQTGIPQNEEPHQESKKSTESNFNEIPKLNYKSEKRHKDTIKKTSNSRMRWTQEEKKIVLKHFSHHIKKKITPKKHECEELLEKQKNILQNKDWVKIKTLVYNTFRLK